MTVSEDQFKNALRCFASGVTVVTTADTKGRFYGITVSAFCSVSLSPPLVLICIEKEASSHPAFIESGAYIVNILRDSQQQLSERFAAPLGDNFADIDFTSGINGIPVIVDALANLECRILKILDGGDHTIFVAAVENTRVQAGTPLLYFRSGYTALRAESE